MSHDLSKSASATRRNRFVAAAVVIALVAGSALIYGGSAKSAPSQQALALAPPAKTLRVTHAAISPRIDDHLDDDAWVSAVVSPRFVDAKSGVVGLPYTELRALWDDNALYVLFYAGDIDVTPKDRFGAILHLPNGDTRVFEVDPQKRIDWRGARGASLALPVGVGADIDLDGTLSDSRDDDEEFVAEVRLPWSALGAAGPTDIRANFFRRDVSRDLPLRQLSWVPWGDLASSDIRASGELKLAR